MVIQEQVNIVKSELVRYVAIVGGLVALFWVIEIIDVLNLEHSLFGLSQPLDYFGVRPRTREGFRQILYMPFLHGNFLHLISNTVPFFVLGMLVIIRSVRDFVFVTVVTAIISGLGAWAFGAANSVHIGASGVVFGYFGYLLLRGFFERSLISIGLGAIVFFFYGSILWGVLPLQQGVSWLGHLFGLIGGGMAAFMLADPAMRGQVGDEIKIDEADLRT